ncbi:MAG TPA: VWA domain-containing protein [Acidisarcina sp.]
MLIMLMVFASGARNLPGQEASASTPAIPAVDKSWPAVNLNVLVLDKHGVPQRVDEREFQLFEDSTERPLTPQGSLDSPVSLALMIDSSGSISKRRDAIIAAAKAIVKGLPARSEVTAILFTDKAFLDLDFTDVSAVDFSFLDRLQAGGPTGLYDAVVATEDHIIAHAKYLKRALVILTDGEDNASHVSREVAFRKMVQPGAPLVYACLTSKANILQRDLMIGHINMRFLAKGGGGTEFNLDPDPESAAVQITNAIRSQYVLQFTAADKAHDGRAHKLAVRLPTKDMEIHTLPVYSAPLN